MKFLAPSLAPVAVVKEIIAALDGQCSKMIFLPFYTQLGPYLGLLPSFLRDFLQWVSRDETSAIPMLTDE